MSSTGNGRLKMVLKESQTIHMKRKRVNAATRTERRKSRGLFLMQSHTLAMTQNTSLRSSRRALSSLASMRTMTAGSIMSQAL